MVAAPSFSQSYDRALRSAEAKRLMAEGRFEAAIPIYRDLIKAAPGNPGLLLNLGLAQHMAGREREAVPTLEAVLKMQPSLLPALISLGAARLALNQPKEAVMPLRKALAADPKNNEVRGMLASALLDSKRLEEAAEQYRKLTEATPEEARAWYGMGMTYQGMAEAAFEQLLKLSPSSPFVSALVAEARMKQRRYRSALVLYNEAATQLPNLHGIHEALAEVYRQTGHADWAAQEEAKERALPATDCEVHAAECQFAGAQHLQIVGRSLAGPPSAETLFWQAKAANELATQVLSRLGQLPPSAELHQVRAEVARGKDQHLESVKEWRAALALMPGHPRLRQELATSLFMAQDFKAALGEIEPLLKADPKSPELNFIAGDSLLRLEQPDKAVPHLKAVLAADPKMLAAAASLGLALSRLGNNAAAIPYLERALELDDDGSLQYQLARAYQATGAREKAAAALSRYQEILNKNQEQKDEIAREAQIGPPR